MAAVARDHPNFALPQSQNTAPVDEFRCLYTHDVRKKQKKWHDGSLRFHTFNRRVMVYDDVKNYIGDLHYRQDDTFGEGVELQLDRGVMVEVGEPMGRTQTDVTALINRGRADPDVASSPTSTVSRVVKRVHANNGTNRPKSLAELLGTPQSRHGRALLPVQSPFEQRHCLNSANTIEPPAKRQRVTTHQASRSNVAGGAEKGRFDHLSKSTPSQPVSDGEQPQISRALVQDAAKPTMDKSLKKLAKQAQSNRPAGPRSTAHIVDISSDDDRPLPQTRVQKQAKNVPESRNSVKPLRNKKQPTSKSRPRPIQRASEAAVPRQRIASSSHNAIQSSLGSNTVPSSSLKITRREGLGTLKLVVSQERRPKLLYRALLPPTYLRSYSKTSAISPRVNRTSEKSAESVGVQASTPDNAHNRRGSHSENILEDLGAGLALAGLGQFVLDMDDAHESQQAVESLPQCSPLFVTQTESQQNRFHSPQPLEVGDDFDQSLINEMNMAMEERAQSPAPPPEPDKIPSSQESAASFSSLDSLQSDAARKSTTPAPEPEVHERVRPPTPQPPAVDSRRPEKARDFRRIVSESNSAAFTEPNSTTGKPSPPKRPPTISNPIVRPLTTVSPNIPRNRSPAKAPPPLHRSHSDPQVVIPQPAQIETADTTLQPTNEQGPWTKMEAFLLFETWPECKRAAQPVIKTPDPTMSGCGDGHVDDGHGNGGNTAPNGILDVHAAQPLSKFRSARMVLRGET